MRHFHEVEEKIIILPSYDRRVVSCKISKAVEHGVRDFVSRNTLDNLMYTNISNNGILDEIVDVIRLGVIRDTRFTIMVGNSKFDINVVYDTPQKTRLVQTLLCFNKKTWLIETRTDRTVIIGWTKMK